MKSFTFCWLLLFAGVIPTAGEPLCAAGSEPFFAIDTARGPIVARLFEEAAPAGVRRLVRLAEGPIFDREIFTGQESVPAAGYYDGLTFATTRPHFEIATGVRPPGNLIEIELEIDAVALGLDRRRIETAAQAMDLAQRELAPAYKARLRSGGVEPRLAEWMEKLRTSHDAGFLVGVSRLEINQALGYRYRNGLASRPALRGALLLRPLSPRRASARLSILLADHPDLDGKAMVIGQVVAGLETAQDISVAPLADPGLVQQRHQPVAPVSIEKIRLVCRSIN
jgi:cyclophilin family peptidyl-prolyl cis-trans isomerase